MNRRYSTARAVFLAPLLMLAGTGFCRAEDFTFNVPVALYNLGPGVTKGRVNCKVIGPYQQSGGKGSNPVSSITYGSGYSEFAITGGTFVGTVVVKFNCTAGMNPANAKTWLCQLYFYHGRSATPGAASSSTQSSGGQSWRGQQRVDIDRLPDWVPADSLASGTTDTTKPYRTSDSGTLK